jgi:hypothetical protein
LIVTLISDLVKSQEPTQIIDFNIKKHDSKYTSCVLSYESGEQTIELWALNKEERQSLIQSLENAIYQLKD